MKVFRATDKQYNAEYHLYEMVEAIKQLSKDDLQEFANASPVFEDAVHLTNKLVKYQAKQFEALVQEVAPMQKLSFDVDLGAKAEEEESEQPKPIFEEVGIDLKPASGFSYLGVRSSDDGHFYKILHIIENDHRCVCVHAHIFVELRKKLKGKHYLFCQSKSDDELIVWIWKAAT